MHEENHSNLKVLNVSNFNVKGEVVLNDVKLLELIQIYPFLYNSFIKPYQDPDYDEWAWNKIATAFNKTYGRHLSRPFSASVLRNRWKFLQPIVIALSKVSKSIPPIMRTHVLTLSAHLENHTPPETYVQKPLSVAQQVIFDNIEMVEKLPFQQRQQLEAEIMHLILNNELKDEERTLCKEGITPQFDTISLIVEKDCEDFFKKIGIDDSTVFENCVELPSESPTLSQNRHFSNGFDTSKPVRDNHDGSPFSTFYINNRDDASEYRNDLKEVTNPTSPSSENKEIPNGSRQAQIDNPRNSPSLNSNNMLRNCPLLMPLYRPHWIELSKVPFYIRKCKVRLKRFTPVEDEVPLARIKERQLNLLGKKGSE